MLPSDHPRPSFPIYENSARPRQLPSSIASSIWAPQPQPSSATWPRALDTFSRTTENEVPPSRRLDHQTANLSAISREDVFGPVGVVGNAYSKDVGAIGDGRKKSNPGFDDTVCSFHCLLSLLFLTSLGHSILNSSFVLLILIHPFLIRKYPLCLLMSMHPLALQISPPFLLRPLF